MKTEINKESPEYLAGFNDGRQEVIAELELERLVYPLTAEQVIDTICKYLNVGLRDVRVASRKRALTYPRQLIMYFLYKETKKSYKDIGKMFGGRDHTTVIHSCRAIEDLLSYDQEVQDQVATIKTILRKLRKEQQQ